MSETLLEKLDRIEAKLKNIQSIKPPKPIDYSKGISILEGINKELSKKLLDITANYERLDKELTVLKSKKPVEQVNYATEILLTNKKIDKLSESLDKIKSTHTASSTTLQQYKHKPKTPHKVQDGQPESAGNNI